MSALQGWYWVKCLSCGDQRREPYTMSDKPVPGDVYQLLCVECDLRTDQMVKSVDGDPP